MRKLLNSILAAFARLMRRLLGLPEPYLEEEYVDEPDAVGEAEIGRSEIDEGLANGVSPTLADRLKLAAMHKLERQAWGVLFEAGELHEREWLEARSDAELRRVAAMDRDALERHLTGQTPIRGLAPLVRRSLTPAELRLAQEYYDLSPSPDPDVTDAEWARLRAEREAEKRGGGKSGGGKGPAKAGDDAGDILQEMWDIVNARAA